MTHCKGSSEILSSLWSLSSSSSKLLSWNIYILIFIETTGANFDSPKDFFSIRNPTIESRGPNVPKENLLPMFYEQILPSYYGVGDKEGSKGAKRNQQPKYLFIWVRNNSWGLEYILILPFYAKYFISSRWRYPW